jgi:hypothetical protein
LFGTVEERFTMLRTDASNVPANLPEPPDGRPPVPE